MPQELGDVKREGAGGARGSLAEPEERREGGIPGVKMTTSSFTVTMR